MQCLPDSLKDRVYYKPTVEDQEEGAYKCLKEIKEWLRCHKKIDF